MTPRPATDAITIGQVLLGKYRVDDVLGQGGMGVVAKCTHLGLNEHVAIKMLRQDVMLDRDATERFTREAQAAHKLKSEHVARVVDVGRFPENDVPYMVMEFLDGHDLGDLIDERGPLQAPFAAMLMLQAAEALAEAHSIGIVHRDVKPSNLFVTWRPDGSALIKVLDFGISKSPMGADLNLTQTQSLLGTPAYMSPEQMRSARLVDSRTDIWSLGTVFYELLEGRRPFEAESFSEMCVKVAVDPPADMVNTPPGLQPIILRCLAKNPDQRYATMAELGRDLLPHVQDVHQASLLVERMQRMLGRATRGGELGAPNRATPLPMASMGSSPAIGGWSPGTDPLGQPMPTPPPYVRAQTSDPRAPDQTLREDSAPARALSDVLQVPQPRPKSKKVLLAGVFLTLGIGGGAVLATQLGSSGRDSTTTTTTAPPDNTGAGIGIESSSGGAKSTDPTSPRSVTPGSSAAGGSNTTAGGDSTGKPAPPPPEPAEITMEPDKPADLGKPKVDDLQGKPRPNVGKPRPKPIVITRKPPKDPTVGKEPIKVPEVKPEVKPDVKTVKPDPVVTPPPGKPTCKILEKLPSGLWPERCAQWTPPKK